MNDSINPRSLAARKGWETRRAKAEAEGTVALVTPEVIQEAIKAEASRPSPLDAAMAASIRERELMHEKGELGAALSELDQMVQSLDGQAKRRIAAKDATTAYGVYWEGVPEQFHTLPLWQVMAQKAAQAPVRLEAYEKLITGAGKVVEVTDDCVTVDQFDGYQVKYEAPKFQGFDPGIFPSVLVGDEVTAGQAAFAQIDDLKLIVAGEAGIARRAVGVISESRRAVTVVAWRPGKDGAEGGYRTAVHEGWPWPSETPHFAYAKSLSEVSRVLEPSGPQTSEEDVAEYIDQWVNGPYKWLARFPPFKQVAIATQRINEMRGIGFLPKQSEAELEARADAVFGPLPDRKVRAEYKRRIAEARGSRESVPTGA